MLMNFDAVRLFPKPAGIGVTIEAKILALPKGLQRCLSIQLKNLVEGVSSEAHFMDLNRKQRSSVS